MTDQPGLNDASAPGRPTGPSTELPKDQFDKAFTWFEEQPSPSVFLRPESARGVPFSLLVMGERISSPTTGNVYYVGQPIGEGAFGTVFSASDEWANRLAIKVLKPKGTYEQIQAAAQDEYRKLFQARHPSVTAVHDFFQLRNAFCIVTEQCDRTIETLFGEPWFVGPLWIMPLARCLLQAVHFLHTVDLPHKDIHAGNVFVQFHRDEWLTTQSNVMTFKLGDLGLAGVEMSKMNLNILPPEALDSSFGPADHRMDIYHCGLLFLKLALNNQRVQFTTEEILQGRPRQLAETLPSHLRHPIAKALRRHVYQRTQTALELWQDIYRSSLMQPTSILATGRI